MRALRTIAGIYFFLFSTISSVSAETYIGILLDGFQRDCSVQSSGETFPCQERRQLYKGDKVTKLPNIHSLKIKWAPYAGGKKLNATTLLVTFEPPENKKGVLENVKEMVGFVKTKHNVAIGATRGGPYGPRVPQPGNHATVMPGQKITFVSESGTGKTIVFKDSDDKEIFTKDLEGALSVQLTPEEIGLKPREVYTWSISGARKGRLFTIRLLSREITKLVTADLMEINREELSEAGKGMKKATYLQFMSDAYPKELDLYWLSYQVLEEIKEKSTLNEDDKILVQELTKSYLKHLSETM